MQTESGPMLGPDSVCCRQRYSGVDFRLNLLKSSKLPRFQGVSLRARDFVTSNVFLKRGLIKRNQNRNKNVKKSQVLS